MNKKKLLSRILLILLMISTLFSIYLLTLTEEIERGKHDNDVMHMLKSGDEISAVRLFLYNEKSLSDPSYLKDFLKQSELGDFMFNNQPLYIKMEQGKDYCH